VPRFVRSGKNLFEITAHETPAGKQYLCVLNPDIDHPADDAIILSGRFKKALDLDVPGGFPIAVKNADRETRFDLRLEPGEFTVIALE
jgi:hypothetical protein